MIYDFHGHKTAAFKSGHGWSFKRLDVSEKIFGKAKEKRENLLKEIDAINNKERLELKVQAEHIQITIQIPSNSSASEVFNFLKGRANKIVSEEMPEFKKLVRGNSFWVDGYF